MLYKEEMEWWRKHPPRPFNLEARPGLLDEVSKQYRMYCERYPHSTVAERKQFHAETLLGLIDKFPTYAELAKGESNA